MQQDSTQHTGENLKHAVDVAAATVTGAAWLEFLPPIAAALSIIWLCVQLFSWVENRWFKKKDND